MNSICMEMLLNKTQEMKMIRPVVFCFFTIALFSFVKFQDVKTQSDPCAVFVAPTSGQIDSLKTKLGDDKFFDFASEKMKAISNARIFLESKNVVIVNADAVGFMEFKKNDEVISKQKLNGMLWGIILFDGKSDPVVADMTNIEKDYDRVFGKIK